MTSPRNNIRPRGPEPIVNNNSENYYHCFRSHTHTNRQSGPVAKLQLAHVAHVFTHIYRWRASAPVPEARRTNGRTDKRASAEGRGSRLQSETVFKTFGASATRMTKYFGVRRTAVTGGSPLENIGVQRGTVSRVRERIIPKKSVCRACCENNSYFIR